MHTYSKAAKVIGDCMTKTSWGRTQDSSEQRR